MTLSRLSPVPVNCLGNTLRHCIILPQTRLNAIQLHNHRRAYTQSASETVQNSLKKYIRWYPGDTVTGSNIDTFFELRRNVSRPNTIVIGVIYENSKAQQSSKVIETLLSDPLAGNSEEWYRNLENRSSAKNNIIVHTDQGVSENLPDAFQRASPILHVNSPFLNSETRLQYETVLEPQDSAANDLQIIEVNKPADVRSVADVCAFYVLVTSDLSTSINSLPHHVQKKVLLTLVDSKEYSPRSLETTKVSFLTDPSVTQHVIKINSHVLAEGIDAFYKLDTQASSQFFDAVQSSNILELRKFLSWYLRTENLRDWIFGLIKTEIASNDLSETQMKSLYDDLKLHTLVKGSQQMHAELQKVFIPETEAFFRKKLRWYMLYLRNDNVEYTIKDYFNSHFMNKSIDSYNYLKGQLVARLQEQKFAKYSEKSKFELKNPLSAYKDNLVNTRVSAEIQPMVYSTLTAAFVYYQLPLSAISLIGYLWVGLDVQTAVAIAALGWVLGFNHVSKVWTQFVNSWLPALFEDVRLVIAKQCMDDGLLKELNTRFEGSKDLARIKHSVLEDLKRAERQEDSGQK